MKQITDWKDKEATISSEYGNISYEKWCEMECERIDKTFCLIKRNPKHKEEVAIFIK